ncbi:MAG: glucosamine inositolphosphorylceramide transferase family protein [Planctomycetota bacterium]|jgi:hypothetical protein
MKRKNPFRTVAIVVAFLFTFLLGALAGKSKRGIIPFVGRRDTWSIGIYSGSSPFDLQSAANAKNPVLSAKDVTDVPAEFVADPFMVIEDNTWYMFFEVFNKNSMDTDIAVAISNDGFSWTYKQIVLDEPFALSYPYVFKWKDQYYMIPETHQARSVRLYKAINFPTKWSFSASLLNGGFPLDPTIFYYADRWWMFVETNVVRYDELRLYYADDLTGPWIEHPKSPVICGDANIARPGGRVIVIDDRLFRYTQDCEPYYGNQVRAFEITELTTTTYEEKEIEGNPVLKGSGTGWNSMGMHNIDPHRIGDNQWIACVDGCTKVLTLGLEY